MGNAMLELVCGWDDRQPLGYAVSQFSAIRRTSEPLRFIPLMERALRYRKLYRRPHERRNGQLWDVISDAPMATQFAISRFLTPWLATGPWALFADFSDMLFLADPVELFRLADPAFAVMVVKHCHRPAEADKMDGQVQTRYPRKNWSSLVLWNLKHPGTARLTKEMVNELPGRDLHRFCWLEDDEIGALPIEWNLLAGVDHVRKGPPKLIHYTGGTPETGVDGPWADEWRKELAIMEASMNRVLAPR